LSLLILTASRFEAEALTERMSRDPAPLPTGVGPIRAALGAAEILASREGLTACLLIGLAGSRDPERAPVGSLVLGNEIVDEAVGAGHGEHFIPLADFGLPAADGTPTRLPLAVPRPGAEPDPPWTVGAIGTVAAASGDPDEAAAWRARNPDVLAEEMEGFAVALACRRADVPLGILRGVSNVAGDRDHGGWQFEAALDAVARATPILLDALRR
jgi:futalosine hydrolase